MENTNNREEEEKGYTPEAGDRINEKKNESQEPAQNLKWDQAQRRHQAGPRSYNESLESENISNQNTDADREQITEIDKDDPNDPKKIGDQISERQQRVDKNEAPGNKNKNNK